MRPRRELSYYCSRIFHQIAAYGIAAVGEFIFDTMQSLALYLSFFHLLLNQAVTETPPPYAATDYILLNCGSSSDSTSLDGRNWEGDFNSKFSPPNIKTTSIASTPSQYDPSNAQLPYTTARVFHNKFTYSFPVSPGLKFVRLYFFPATYSGLDKSKSFSVVTANNFTLLSNFSAFLTVSSIEPPVATVIKEFIIPVLHTQYLNITFIPSPRSYAFINGIEIVSIPNNLYMHNRDPDVMITMVDNNISPFYFDDTTALETMYRLNVGGNDVSGVEDTGMFRTWRQDSEYLFGPMIGLTHNPRSNVTIRYTTGTPAYTAPEIVYKTSRSMGLNATVNLNSNLTWIFTVDGGFNYLFRLHFCETLQEVVKTNERVFYIFTNNQTAEVGADVIQWSGGNGIPVYREYVVLVPCGNKAKQDLWLALHPNWDFLPHPLYASAILNGLEIFKLNRSDGTLAGLNPELKVINTHPAPEPRTKLKEKTNRLSSMIAIITGGVVGGVLAIFVIFCFFVYRRNTRVKDSGSTTSEPRSSWVPFSRRSCSTNNNASSLPSAHCRHFLLADLKAATRDFDDHLVIGSGGFGNVYKGYIDGGLTRVAIKRLNPSSKQGNREFWTEIELLSKLRHVNLVQLIGYCDDQGEMILVYDFMARGTLRDHLYNTKNPPLPWKRRLEICLGAAHGLHYLHCGAKHTIIHRDVKSTNVLLDEKWVAKVSDFGLSRKGPTSMSQTHVSTVVKGSFGYVDPEYYRRRQLTVKSDVYSFGVVLFEVLCARPALVPGLPKERVSLAEWGRKCYQSGTLGDIVDPHLRAEIAPACLNKFGEIADSCLRGQGIDRPEMSDVVWGLEFALQLQDAADRKINGIYEEVNLSQIQVAAGGAGPSSCNSGGEISTADDDDLFSSSGALVSDNLSSDKMVLDQSNIQRFSGKVEVLFTPKKKKGKVEVAKLV